MQPEELREGVKPAVEFRHIRYFVALAEELNFNRAAKRLHIAQPPLSRQIRKLEKQIGTQLFHRSKRQVQLTAAGKAFLNKAYQIMDQMEQAYIHARMTGTGLEGEIRIGFTGSVHDIIPTIREFRSRFPHIGVYLKHLNSLEQIEALHKGRLDLGVVGVPIHHPQLEVYPVAEVPFMAVLPENHPLADQEPLYLRDLAEETFIITPRSTGQLYYDMITGLFQQSGILPSFTIQAHDLQTVMALVESGMGVTLMPSYIQSYKGIVFRKVKDAEMYVQALLVWRKDNHSPVLDNLLGMIRK
jgi:DNA-binding transcriptional LysR family regulator